MNRLIKIVAVVLCAIALISFLGMQIYEDVEQKNQWEATRVVHIVCVDRGETLDEIGYRFKPEWMDVREYRHYIMEFNGMENSNLYAGQDLKVYVCTEQYTKQGLVLDDGTLVTTDGHEWDYDTTIKGCVNVTFNDNGTDDVTDDIIVDIERR